MQQIGGKRRQVLAFGPHDDFGTSAPAPIPTRPEPRFVIETKRDGLLEGDDLEPPPAKSFVKRGFEQQPVGIGREGEAGDVRRERLQDTVAPVGHWTDPAAVMEWLNSRYVCTAVGKLARFRENLLQLAELNTISLNFPFGTGSFLSIDEQCWAR